MYSSVSVSERSLFVYSVLVSLCAVVVSDVGHAVLVPVGMELGQLRAGRGYKIHLWSRT